MTYGDALSNINLQNLKEFHNKYKPTVTVTAVRPPARFGSLEINDFTVERFGEKDQAKEAGLMVAFLWSKIE